MLKALMEEQKTYKIKQVISSEMETKKKPIWEW